MRKACEDLLPAGLVWRKKAQFDEGSGTVDARDRALSKFLGGSSPVGRESEGGLYERLLREACEDPDLIPNNAGMWVADRVAV